MKYCILKILEFSSVKRGLTAKGIFWRLPDGAKAGGVPTTVKNLNSLIKEGKVIREDYLGQTFFKLK